MYTPGSLPQGTSWIYSLTAQQADQQCTRLGLTPNGNLAKDRETLKAFVKQQAEAKDPLKVDTLTNPMATERGPDLQHTTPHPVIVDNPIGTTAPVADTLPVQEIISQTAIAVGTQVALACAQARPQSPTRLQPAPTGRILDQLIADIPITSGTQPKSLVTFLVKALKIESLQLTTTSTLLLSLLPRTTHQLRTVWSQGLPQCQNLQSMSNTIMEFFIPQHARQTLISELIYRGQGEDESLADYVTNLQEVAQLLTPSLPTSDLLEIALIGLNHRTRSCMAAFPSPTSLSDLFNFTPRLQVIQTLQEQTTHHYTPNQGAPSPRTSHSTHHLNRYPHNFTQQYRSNGPPPRYNYQPHNQMPTRAYSAYRARNPPTPNGRPPFHRTTQPLNRQLNPRGGWY